MRALKPYMTDDMHEKLLSKWALIRTEDQFNDIVKIIVQSYKVIPANEKFIESVKNKYDYKE